MHTILSLVHFIRLMDNYVLLYKCIKYHIFVISMQYLYNFYGKIRRQYAVHFVLCQTIVWNKSLFIIYFSYTTIWT